MYELIKAVMIGWILLANMSTLSITRCTQKENEAGKLILAHFAQIVVHFFNILQDPNNTAVLVSNLNRMASEVIAIAAEVFKKNPHRNYKMPFGGVPQRHPQEAT